MFKLQIGKNVCRQLTFTFFLCEIVFTILKLNKNTKKATGIFKCKHQKKKLFSFFESVSIKRELRFDATKKKKHFLFEHETEKKNT